MLARGLCVLLCNDKSASGASLWRAVGTQQLLAVISSPWLQGGLCCFCRAPICGLQPGRLPWDLDKVSAQSRHCPALGIAGDLAVLLRQKKAVALIAIL